MLITYLSLLRKGCKSFGKRYEVFILCNKKENVISTMNMNQYLNLSEFLKLN